MTDGTPIEVRGCDLWTLRDGRIVKKDSFWKIRTHGLTLAMLDLADGAVAQSVLELQRESYAVEAGLIGDDRIPQLTETLDELRAAGLEWLGARDADGLTGAVAWKVLDDGTVDIHRLVVAPRAFRRGVATGAPRRPRCALPGTTRARLDRPGEPAGGDALPAAWVLSRARARNHPRAIRDRAGAV